MAVLFSDRGEMYVNGLFLQDTQSMQININDGVRIVGTMTADRRSKGWVRGNREITFSFEIAVQDKLASAKVENIDCDTQDVSIMFKNGADKYLLKSIAISTVSQSAGGVGQEARKSYSGVALDITDMVGNSALFETSLKSFT